MSTTQEVTTTTTTTTSSSSSLVPASKGTMQALCLFMNCGVSVFMGITGIYGIASVDDITDTGILFVGLYMVFFATMLFVFELVQKMQKGGSLDILFLKNCGFLYGTVGKSLYIIFMAIMAFGMTNLSTLSLGCGIVVLAWGCLQISLYYSKPECFDHVELYIPP